MLLLPFTIKLAHFYRGISFFLFSLLILQITPVKGITTSQQIDSLVNILKVSKGEREGLILGSLVSLYSATDTVRYFGYFTKLLDLDERYNYNYQEAHSFNSLTGSLHGKEQFNRKIQRLQQALNYAEKKNYQKAIGYAVSSIGYQYFFANNFAVALKYQDTALKRFQKINYDYGIAFIRERLGVILMVKNDYIKALKNYYQALKINQRLNLQHETGISLYHIGIIKFRLGDYPEAIEYILKSIKYWVAPKEAGNLWNCNELMGVVYIKMGDYYKALKYHRIALHIREQVAESNRRKGYNTYPDLGIAYSYNNISEVYLNLGIYDSAFYYAIRSLKLMLDKNSFASKNDIANAKISLGNIYAKLGNYDSALLLLNQAAKTTKSIQNKSVYAEALFGLSRVYIKFEDYSKAIFCLVTGINEAKKIGDRDDVKNGYRLLSDLYLSLNNYRKSLDYYKRYIGLKDSILSLANKSRIEELQVKYDVDNKGQEIAHQKVIITQKKQKFFLSFFVGFLVVIIALLIMLYVIRNKKQKEDILLQRNENLRKELELKNKDLICNVSKIFIKNQVINKVARILISSSGDFKQTNTKLIREIISELKQNMDETGWKEFDIRFARVHENFYSELDRRFPDLTKTERKLCALLKLGMSSKEIAAITRIRSESVDTARSRLRKKLGLTNEDGLFEFLNGF